jgi:hypothetical protein
LIPDQEEPPPRSPETIAREPAAPTPTPEIEAAPAPAPEEAKTRYDWRGLLDPRKRR